MAQAVALNEHRADFGGVSIHDSPETQNTARRVEQGFIGAHSDIGGGYGEGDLNHVAFMWMVNQARSQGVRVNETLIRDLGWSEVHNPILHDNVGVSPVWPYTFSGPDRKFRYLKGAVELQKSWSGFGLSQDQIRALHDRQFTEMAPCRPEVDWVRCDLQGLDLGGDRTKIGAVSAAYSTWLKEHYGLDISIDHSRLNWEADALKEK